MIKPLLNIRLSLATLLCAVSFVGCKSQEGPTTRIVVLVPGMTMDEVDAILTPRRKSPQVTTQNSIVYNYDLGSGSRSEWHSLVFLNRDDGNVFYGLPEKLSDEDALEWFDEIP